MPRKKPAPLPSGRDVRIREAMAALLQAGTPRKAAEICGVPYRTIGTWAKSAEGQAITEELKKAVGTDIADDLRRILAKQLKLYEAGLEKINPRDLPIHIGIFFDKLQKLEPKKETSTDYDEVTVEWGGVRVDEGGDGVAAEGVRITQRRTRRPEGES